MLMPEAQVRIWLYAPPTEMRKSFDGLSALVRQKLAEDPLSGQLFVFLNRRRTQLKILYFDRSGYCVWAKRLEQGEFHPRGKPFLRRRRQVFRLRLEGRALLRISRDQLLALQIPVDLALLCHLVLRSFNPIPIHVNPGSRQS